MVFLVSLSNEGTNLSTGMLGLLQGLGRVNFECGEGSCDDGLRQGGVIEGMRRCDEATRCNDRMRMSDDGLVR